MNNKKESYETVSARLQKQVDADFEKAVADVKWYYQFLRIPVVAVIVATTMVIFNKINHAHDHIQNR